MEIYSLCSVKSLKIHNVSSIEQWIFDYAIPIAAYIYYPFISSICFCRLFTQSLYSSNSFTRSSICFCRLFTQSLYTSVSFIRSSFCFCRFSTQFLYSSRSFIRSSFCFCRFSFQSLFIWRFSSRKLTCCSKDCFDRSEFHQHT